MAQPINLVPNGSFEDTIDFGNGFLAPKLWDMTLGSPDYFTALFDPPYESRRTPQNFYGNQKPKEGKAYIGLIIKYDIPETREYMQIKLIDTLIKDSLYNFSLWINMPDSFHLACGQKNTGFAFSDTMIEYPQSQHNYINWLSPIYNSNLMWNPTNKTEWEKISTQFIANGSELYLILGNFFLDASTPIQNIGGGNKPTYKKQSYYFIDKIELYKHYTKDTLSDTSISKKIIIPNIFTPNGDGINDEWKPLIANTDKFHVQIFNRWGNLLKEWSEVDGYWDGDSNKEGVYFYNIVYFIDKKKYEKAGSITLIR